jgi:hypothetical protein
MEEHMFTYMKKPMKFEVRADTWRLLPEEMRRRSEARCIIRFPAAFP